MSYSRLSNEMQVNFEFFVDQIFKLFAAFNKVTALLEQWKITY